VDSIGNKIGRFLGCEPEWETKMDRRYGWLQIEVDLRDGLIDKIELVFGGFMWLQHIDYWRVPFICFGCHEAGHLKERKYF